MNLTEHFTLAELTVTNTGLDNSPTDPKVILNLKKLALGLEEVRKVLKQPIRVTSGFRGPAVNVAVKGSQTSQHLQGLAADFTCPKFGTPTQIMKAIFQSNILYDQCILEYPENGGWIHISFSDKPRKQALIINKTGSKPYAP